MRMHIKNFISLVFTYLEFVIVILLGALHCEAQRSSLYVHPFFLWHFDNVYEQMRSLFQKDSFQVFQFCAIGIIALLAKANS